MPEAFETRTVTAEVEFRDDTDGPTLIGHAATFNQPYPVGGFREQIHPQAFDATLRKKADVRLLVDHSGQPLARTKSGTLTLGTDRRGLTVEANLDPVNPDVQRLMSVMKRGDMDQMSFGFRVPKGGDDWDYSGDAPFRTIREANLAGGDVSVVTYPANENADAQMRVADDTEAAYTLILAMTEEMRDGRTFTEPSLRALLEAYNELGLDLRATVSTADINDLPDDDFAYIEPGGTKDADGKTVPRSLRHFPIQDAAHVRNALARAADSPFGPKAMPKILAAAKKYDIEVSGQNSSGIPLELARRIAERRRRSAA